MNRFRERKSWIVLVAVLLLFAACKGESPTAPPPGGGTPPGSGTPPPTGVSIVLAASNLNPLVDSSVTITATVTNNGNAVPNGTAVEFSSTGGVLDSSGGTAIIKTTTNGVATVTLTSGTAGLIRVTAVVSNVSRQIDITFQSRPVIPPPPGTAPTITSVTPSIGRPQGGEVIRITGANFRSPVRVLFNTGGALPVEGSVQSVSDTQIEVITPPVNLGAGQQLVAAIIVLTQAGTGNEQRVEQSSAFTYRNEQLTPVISTVSPNSGPVTGGTRVTIFGEGFQDPVQVLFGTAEARVLTVQFDRILVETPAGRDTNPDGSGAVTGPVTVTVRNINSQTEAAMSSGFHYKAAMQITAVTVSGDGSTAGGTRLTIEGIGFVAPVVVVVQTDQGDIGLNQISVTGTQIVALTPAIIVASCDDELEGPIVVTNVNNGDQAEGPTFRFNVLAPAIISVETPITEGVDTTFDVVVANPIPGVTRFQVGEKTVFPTTATDLGNGTVRFTLAVPTNLDFPTEDCGVGGTRSTPLDLDITYDPPADGCEDTVEQALTINPADISCVLPPPAEVTQLVPVPPSCADSGSVVAVGTATGTATITFRNDGGQTLLISRGTITDPQFTVAPASAAIEPGQSGSFTVTFDPTAVGAQSGNVTFTTNDPDEGSIIVCLTGNGT